MESIRVFLTHLAWGWGVGGGANLKPCAERAKFHCGLDILLGLAFIGFTFKWQSLSQTCGAVKETLASL